MKALIIAAPGVQDVELVYPYYRLQEAGYAVTIAAENAGEFHGIQGVKFQADTLLADEAEWRAGDYYDMLVIPGGVKAMEKLRLNAAALHIVAEQHRHKRVIAAICSGAQLLISAKIVNGKRLSAYYAMRVDVENAGAMFVDEPAVVCDRIVTSPHYKHLGPWMKAALSEVERVNGFREGAACAAVLP